ncbi:MAG: signal peptide peptidase SppA [Euryarchaeota archaeon]|nr:signal peptide peptidase SppA [Euryarchaeota archaeon]
MKTSAVVIAVVFALAYAVNCSIYYNNRIEVFKVEGVIENFDMAEGVMALGKDPDVEGIVLKVNSPGGGVYASKELEKAVRKVSKQKPVVCVIEEYGASGAYYAASAASYIYAHENSAVLAIGVLAVWPDYSEHFEEEGIKYWIWKSTEKKDFGAPWRSPTEEEKELLQGQIDLMYEEFVETVAKNREMKVEKVKQNADGMVYLGKDAAVLGYIDEVGNFEDAVEKTVELSKKSKYILVSKEDSSWDMLKKSVLKGFNF